MRQVLSMVTLSRIKCHCGFRQCEPLQCHLLLGNHTHARAHAHAAAPGRHTRSPVASLLSAGGSCRAPDCVAPSPS